MSEHFLTELWTQEQEEAEQKMAYSSIPHMEAVRTQHACAEQHRQNQRISNTALVPWGGQKINLRKKCKLST